MKEEVNLESLTKRYAPSSQEPISQEFDQELLAQLKSIPDKLAFKIGEVADLAEVKSYVLRYWESEFEALRPKKSKHNQRVYTRKDVETVLMIKKLLYKDRFSIAGARVALKRLRKDSKHGAVAVDRVGQVESIRTQVEDLLISISRVKNIFS